MRTIALTLVLFASTPALAGEHRGLDTLAVAGGGLAGQGLGAIAGIFTAAAIGNALTDCPPDAGGCGESSAYMSVVYGVTAGGGLGAFGGATAAAALVHGDTRGVALASGLTAGGGLATNLLGGALGNASSDGVADVGAGLYGVGAAAAILGPVPAATVAQAVRRAPAAVPAAESAAAEPATPPAPAAARPQLTLEVAPVLAPQYRGLAIRGRF